MLVLARGSKTTAFQMKHNRGEELLHQICDQAEGEQAGPGKMMMIPGGYV